MVVLICCIFRHIFCFASFVLLIYLHTSCSGIFYGRYGIWYLSIWFLYIYFPEYFERRGSYVEHLVLPHGAEKIMENLI